MLFSRIAVELKAFSWQIKTKAQAFISFKYVIVIGKKMPSLLSLHVSKKHYYLCRDLSGL